MERNVKTFVRTMQEIFGDKIVNDLLNFTLHSYLKFSNFAVEEQSNCRSVRLW